MDKKEIILRLATSFIKKKARDRSVFELNSLKKRQKFASRISDWELIFDPQYVTQLSIGLEDRELMIDSMPIQRKAKCYIISSFGEFDDMIMEFEDAIKFAATGGCGTLIYDYKENVAFLEEEYQFGSPKRYVLKQD